jgi:hypothetical protein
MKKILSFLLVTFVTISGFAQSSLDNEFYLRLGYSSPSWQQFDGEKSNWNGASKFGVVGEIGTIFMFRKIPLPENMAIGLDVDYLTFCYNQFSYQNDTYDLGTLRFDSKIGPSFTISPVKDLAFDAYVKADIAWITAAVEVYDGNTDDADAYANIGTVGVSTGINFRYKILMLGIEYNTVSPELENVDDDSDFLGSFYSNNKKSPLPCLNFTIGLSF